MGRFHSHRNWIAIVSQVRTDRTKMLLESNQSWVIQVGPSEIEMICAHLFALLNGLPEQQRHYSQAVKARIRAAVFVYKRILVRQCNNAANGIGILRQEMNGQFIAQEMREVAKPDRRLWWQSVAPTRKYQEIQKLIQQCY